MRPLFTCFLLLAACSSTPTTNTNPDAGGKDSSPPQDSGGTPDAGVVVNGCGPTDFVAANTITWSFTVMPKCVSIKPGDSVTWNGSFGIHTLDAFGGDSPNPITGTGTADGGASVTIKFPTAGTFGFHCANHATMLGAVKVAP